MGDKAGIIKLSSRQTGLDRDVFFTALRQLLREEERERQNRKPIPPTPTHIGRTGRGVQARTVWVGNMPEKPKVKVAGSGG